jgi:hypothetical protein
MDNDVISQALVNHMKRRHDADRCSDLYTIEASNTLKTSHPSSTRSANKTRRQVFKGRR